MTALACVHASCRDPDRAMLPAVVAAGLSIELVINARGADVSL